MAKIAYIGAGSHKFAQNIITGILSYPELRGSTIALMDIDKEHLDLNTAFARKLVEQNGFKTQIESTTNRRKVLEGTDYVIVTIAAGGWDLAKYDQKVTLKYGLEWDDTMGPCGVFFGLRQIQDTFDICHDMEELCPDAWLIAIQTRWL